MSAIDNSKLVLELFNFKKTLKIEQDDNIEQQVNFHLGLFNCDEVGNIPSQRNITRSLMEKLKTYKYDKSVAALLENLTGMLSEDELFYDLEDLYRTLESQNQGNVLSHAMQIVLNILNESSVQSKTVKILNDLRTYEWLAPVKQFLFKYTTNPMDRQNLTSQGGKCEPVYSIVEKIKNEKDNGFLTFVGDKWFLLTNEDVNTTSPGNHIEDREKLQHLGLLETALRIGIIEDDTITFTVEEGLTIGVDLKNGDLYLNEEKTDKETTIESVFESALIPFQRRDLYPVISETIKHLDKFVDLDMIQRVTNITNPTLECYAFNYKEKMYMFWKDARVADYFYEYDSASMLVSEVKSQLGYDLSKFFENKFSQEVVKRRNLEDQEKVVVAKISELSENMQKLKATGLVESNRELNAAYNALVAEKLSAKKDLFKIKGALVNGK